jgi:hypothetical protein
MGTLGEKQDKPLLAYTSPPRFGFYWQRLHLNRHKGNGQSWQRLQLAYILAMLTLEPIPCRHAALISPRPLATFTPPTMHRLVDFPRATTATRRTHWQQCHRPAIARAYQNRNRNKNNCVKVY